MPLRTRRLRRVVGAGEIFLDHQAQQYRDRKPRCRLAVLPSIPAAAHRTVPRTRPTPARPAAAIACHDAESRSERGPSCRRTSARSAVASSPSSAPQHARRRFSTCRTLSPIAIRKIIEGRIEGKPVPHPNAVDDLWLWQPPLLYQLQEFRARHVKVGSGPFRLHGARRIGHIVLKLPRHDTLSLSRFRWRLRIPVTARKRCTGSVLLWPGFDRPHDGCAGRPPMCSPLRGSRRCTLFVLGSRSVPRLRP